MYAHHGLSQGCNCISWIRHKIGNDPQRALCQMAHGRALHLASTARAITMLFASAASGTGDASESAAAQVPPPSQRVLPWERELGIALHLLSIVKAFPIQSRICFRDCCCAGTAAQPAGAALGAGAGGWDHRQHHQGGQLGGGRSEPHAGHAGQARAARCVWRCQEAELALRLAPPGKQQQGNSSGAVTMQLWYS